MSLALYLIRLALRPPLMLRDRLRARLGPEEP